MSWACKPDLAAGESAKTASDYQPLTLGEVDLAGQRLAGHIDPDAESAPALSASANRDHRPLARYREGSVATSPEAAVGSDRWAAPPVSGQRQRFAVVG